MSIHCALAGMRCVLPPWSRTRGAVGCAPVDILALHSPRCSFPWLGSSTTFISTVISHSTRSTLKSGVLQWLPCCTPIKAVTLALSKGRPHEELLEQALEGVGLAYLFSREERAEARKGGYEGWEAEGIEYARKAMVSAKGTKGRRGRLASSVEKIYHHLPC